ncbi:MAG: hypothetical protein AB1428_14690 [Bacteroidota bacterium]
MPSGKIASGALPLLPLIGGQYLIKMLVTVVSVPLIYAARSITWDDAAQ